MGFDELVHLGGVGAVHVHEESTFDKKIAKLTILSMVLLFPREKGSHPRAKPREGREEIMARSVTRTAVRLCVRAEGLYSDGRLWG